MGERMRVGIDNAQARTGIVRKGPDFSFNRKYIAEAIRQLPPLGKLKRYPEPVREEIMLRFGK